MGLVVLEFNHCVHFAPAEAEEVGLARLIASGQRVDQSQCIPFLFQGFEAGGALIGVDRDALELAKMSFANAVVLLKKIREEQRLFQDGVTAHVGRKVLNGIAIVVAAHVGGVEDDSQHLKPLLHRGERSILYHGAQVGGLAEAGHIKLLHYR